MREAVLFDFPPHVHSFILVSDPDHVLDDETILKTLIERGFTLLQKDDPAALRMAYRQAQPVTTATPLVVVTSRKLDQLPYDLWQQSHHVTLALHTFFPNLDYPTVRQLSPGQRSVLARAVAGDPISRPLSVKASQTYVLEHVFGITPAVTSGPSSMLLWLDAYHSQVDPMPPILVAVMGKLLQSKPWAASWPVVDLLSSPDAYRRFVRSAWSDYVSRTVKESGPDYTASSLAFATDPALQDALPRLLRSGTLEPMQIDQPAHLPRWTQPALSQDELGVHRRKFTEGLAAVGAILDQSTLAWTDWQVLARRWAQLTLSRYHTRSHMPIDPDQERTFGDFQTEIDARFLAWLQTQYASLSARRLPTPHHLFHVPGYLADQRRNRTKVALLILDGMSLAVWQQIRRVWELRHPTWDLEEKLVLAQIPTITAISRQALISGMPPSQFADSLTHNQREGELWRLFWQNQGLAASAISLAHLSARTAPQIPANLDSRRTQALCLISPVIDAIVHGATQGLADVHASVQLWLDQDANTGSLWLEEVVERLLKTGYAVFVTSDHGHVACMGMGQPQEGVTVTTRSKRARLYSVDQFAQSVQDQYPDTVLWSDDGLLPKGLRVLMPQLRQAFAPHGAQVVSHGGVTIEEMIIPLVQINRRS